MQKIIISFISALFFIFTFSYESDNVLPTNNGLTIYKYSCSSNCKFSSIKKDEQFLISKKYYQGESTTISDEQKKQIIKKYHAKKIKTEIGQNYVCEYYYSPLLPKYISLYNNKVNLQFCSNENLLSVGYPFIFGWY